MTTTTSRLGFLRKPWVIGTIIVVLLGVGYGIYQSRSNAAATTKTNTIAVVKGNLVTTISGSSNIAAKSSVSLVFQSSGVIKDVLVTEGEKVAKGQILATLDGRDLQYSLDGAKAALDSAKAKLAQLTSGTGRDQRPRTVGRIAVTVCGQDIDPTFKGRAGTDESTNHT